MVIFEPRYPNIPLREEMIEFEKRNAAWITLMPRGPESTDSRFGSTRMASAKDQAAILRTLYWHGPLEAREIGRFNGVSVKTIVPYGVRALRNLEWDNYIMNDQHPGVSVYALTEKGRKVAEQC